MRTIWVVPLAADPIFFNECPRGSRVGDVQIRWAELKFIQSPLMRDAELHCNCSQGIACCQYSLDRVELLTRAEQLRLGLRPPLLRTSDGEEVELKKLELRKAEIAQRSQQPSYRAAAVA